MGEMARALGKENVEESPMSEGRLVVGEVAFRADEYALR